MVEQLCARNDAMNSKSSKTDVIVSDPDAAMRRTILAARGALAVPKAKIDAAMAKEKNGHAKRK
jgi:hypothetical protein